MTTRAELVEDQADHPPYGSHLAEPLVAYVRLANTSGRIGPPLRWLFTRADAERQATLWHTALVANEVEKSDRVVLDERLWACWDALFELGALAIPRAEAHAARVREVLEQQVTVVVCSPSDALRLGEAAAAQHVDLAESAVRLVIVTGEPGGHVPSTRRRIEESFGARCADVYALTEFGVVGWDCPAQDDALHLNDEEFTIEVDADELVLTSRAATGMPVLRYRTGDLVRLERGPCACGRTSSRAVGGVLGRVAERLQVRGVELLPSVLENIVRRHPAVTEYELEVYQVRGGYEVAIDIEPDEAVASEGDRARVAAEVAADVKQSLGLRLQCEAVPPRSMERTESRPQRLRARMFSRQ